MSSSENMFFETNEHIFKGVNVPTAVRRISIVPSKSISKPKLASRRPAGVPLDIPHTFPAGPGGENIVIIQHVFVPARKIKPAVHVRIEKRMKEMGVSKRKERLKTFFKEVTH